MEKILRFAARHPAVCMVVPCLFPALPLSVALSAADVSLGFHFACIAAVLYPFFILGKLSPMFLMNPKVKVLNRECDPLPLLEVTSFLLTCRLSPAHRMVTAMNQAVALRDTGAYEEALKVMKSIDLNKPRRIPAMAKFVYFHNLAEFLDNAGHREEADAIHARALEFWDTIPQRRKTPVLHNTIRFARASSFCRHGTFPQAVEILQDMECIDPRQQVERGMVLARCAIALGQYQRAREWLTYVITHGNRLHIADQARSMLKNLENS